MNRREACQRSPQSRLYGSRVMLSPLPWVEAGGGFDTPTAAALDGREYVATYLCGDEWEDFHRGWGVHLLVRDLKGRDVEPTDDECTEFLDTLNAAVAAEQEISE